MCAFAYTGISLHVCMLCVCMCLCTGECAVCEITKLSHTPHHEILGAPIGDEIFCNNFVAHKQSNVSFLLHQLRGGGEPQVALALL